MKINEAKVSKMLLLNSDRDDLSVKYYTSADHISAQTVIKGMGNDPAQTLLAEAIFENIQGKNAHISFDKSREIPDLLKEAKKAFDTGVSVFGGEVRLSNGINYEYSNIIKGAITGNIDSSKQKLRSELQKFIQEQPENDLSEITLVLSKKVNNEHFINTLKDDFPQIIGLDEEINDDIIKELIGPPKITHIITVTANPSGGGEVTGGETYENNATVTVTATPNSGYDFVNWTINDVEVSTNETYIFKATESITLVANFMKKPEKKPETEPETGSFPWKRIVIIVGIVLVLGVGGYFGYKFFWEKGVPPPPDSITLNKTSLEFETTGASEQLKATVLPANVSGKNKNVTWLSDDETVATVDSEGVVMAVSGGNTKIMAYTSNGLSATCHVNVDIDSVPVLVTGVTLKTSLSLKKGDTAQLTETVEPEEATNKNVTWSSDKPTIVTVSSTGLVTAIAEKGSAKITVTTADGKKTATCTVTIVSPPSPTPKPDPSPPPPITAKYGQTLSQLSLPSGWSWAVPGTTSVGNAGRNIFKANYKGSDIYNAVSNVDVTVIVQADNSCEHCLQNANNLFAQKKYADAKKQYESCKTYNCNSTDMNKKIAECDKLCNAYAIKSISGKDVKIGKGCDGKISNVSNGDIFKVWEVTTTGNSTSKVKIGELKVTAVKSNVIECKFKDGDKKITDKFRARANLLIEK